MNGSRDVDLTEDRIVAWLRRKPETSGLVGDDAAVLPAGGPWAVTVDSQRAGVHIPEDLDPAIFARRLLAVTLSDLAATGATPAYAFLALGTPRTFEHRRFFRALLADCGRLGLTLAGGDLSLSDRPEATLTVLGTRPPHGRWLTRGGAVAGDALWLGGTLGESAVGRLLVALGARVRGNRITLPELGTDHRNQQLARRAVRRHLVPTPQLELGGWLGRRRRRVAAIDLSDGLAIDLRRLCQESARGGVIEEASLPAPAGFEDLATALGTKALDLLLGGGEDYVLLFTLPEGAAPPKRFRCHRIGSITTARRLRLRTRDGALRPLPRLGWDHYRTCSTRAD